MHFSILDLCVIDLKKFTHLLTESLLVVEAMLHSIAFYRFSLHYGNKYLMNSHVIVLI